MRELIVFAGVGLMATATHYLVAICLVSLLQVELFSANIVAYCCAVGVSFFGHSILTFRVQLCKKRLLKFILVSISALLLSQALLYLLVKAALFPYQVNMLFVVAFIPAISYLLNKFWVYRA